LAIINISEKQIAAVLALPGSERYRHFVKRVADFELVWGLFEDGWALAGSSDDVKVLPLWPAQEYAKLCAVGVWGNYVPRSFSVQELLHDLLPMLDRDGVLPGIFYTPNDKGVTPTINRLRHDIEAELQNYE
jgi:hypothetical protein